MCGAFRDIFLLKRNTSTFGRQNVEEMLVARKISMFERQNVDEMFVQGMFIPKAVRFPG